MRQRNSNSSGGTILGLFILLFLGYAALQPTPSSTPVPLPTATRTALETALYQTPGLMKIAKLIVTPGESTVDVYVEAAVAREFNTQATAATMHRASIRGLSTVFLTFSCILDDGTTAISYTWSNATDSFTVTPLTSFNATRAAMPPSLPTSTPPDVAPVLDAPTEAATLAIAPTAVPVMVQALKPLTVFSAPINAPAHRIGQIKQGGKIILSGLSPDANWYYFSYYDRPAWITSDSASVTVLSGEVGSLSVIIPDPTATPLPIVPTPDPVPPTTVPIIVPRPTRNSPAVGACSPCPHSCDAAVAMGCTAVQAAACGLDRDKDGVACYGD